MKKPLPISKIRTLYSQNQFIMKKYSVTCFLLFVFLTIVYGFSGGGLKYPSGAPAGYTGSPGDGQNCTHCHGGVPATVTGWITSDIPETGYVPGQTYLITATSTGSGKKGFEVSPQNFAGDFLGTLVAGSGSKLVGNNAYITHTNGVSSSTATWNFQWTAPAEGTGDVVFYGAFAIKESHTRLTSLLVHEDNTVSITQTRAQRFKVYPNPVKNRLTITYRLEKAQAITARLYTLDGKLVSTLVNEQQSAGSHTSATMIGQSAERGVYLLQVTFDAQSFTKKLLVK